MNIEGVRIGQHVHDDSIDRLGRSVVDYMVNTTGTMHDRGMAAFLALASSYAYSDVATFARGMARLGLGLGTETVRITSTSAELRADATAYLVQSADGRVAILAFRGMATKNVTSWLMDTGTLGARWPFQASIHGGLYRTFLRIWPTIRSLLEYVVKGYSICAGAVRYEDTVRDCMREARWRGEMSRVVTEGELEPDVVGHLPPLPPENAGDKLEALYITGHGTGGALGVIAALFLQHHSAAWNPRGVYTYGQPMVGDERLRRQFESVERLAKFKLHRHVYEADVVPRLPPRTMGKFVHFGDEFGSSDSGWVCRHKAVTQVLTGAGAAIVGLSPFVQAQLDGVPTLLRTLLLPYSLTDHNSLNYVHTSENGFPPLLFPRVKAR